MVDVAISGDGRLSAACVGIDGRPRSAIGQRAREEGTPAPAEARPEAPRREDRAAQKPVAKTVIPEEVNAPPIDRIAKPQV